MKKNKKVNDIKKTQNCVTQIEDVGRPIITALQQHIKIEKNHYYRIIIFRKNTQGIQLKKRLVQMAYIYFIQVNNSNYFKLLILIL